jgi:hypothetical protein
VTAVCNTGKHRPNWYKIQPKGKLTDTAFHKYRGYANQNLELTEYIKLCTKFNDSHTKCIMNDFKRKFAAVIMSIMRLFITNTSFNHYHTCDMIILPQMTYLHVFLNSGRRGQATSTPVPPHLPDTNQEWRACDDLPYRSVPC